MNFVFAYSQRKTMLQYFDSKQCTDSNKHISIFSITHKISITFWFKLHWQIKLLQKFVGKTFKKGNKRYDGTTLKSLSVYYIFLLLL